MLVRRSAHLAPRHALVETVEDESLAIDPPADSADELNVTSRDAAESNELDFDELNASTVDESATDAQPLPFAPRHATRTWRARQQSRLLLVPVVVATVITGLVVAFNPAPTTVAEPEAQISVQSAVAEAFSTTSSAGASPSASSASPSATASATPSATTQPSASASPASEASASATASASPTPSPSASAKAGSLTVTGTRWTTTGVNIRSAASTSSSVVTQVAAGTELKITANASNGFQQVVWNKSPAWVSSQYLSSKKPSVTSSGGGGAGISGAPCKSGSGVEAGLVPNAIAVHRAVCANFPYVTRYIGRGGGGNHAAGRALDIMVSGASGWEIANWLRANASRLGITEVIYAQRIWTTQRSGEGWRWMSNRGSNTANHYDHVHVTVR